MSDKKIPFIIFFAGLLIFTYGLGDLEFTRIDCRYGFFAQEMSRNGISFFPTLYGKAYPDYPAAQTVLIYLTSLVTGKINMFSAVLPSAVFASLTLVFIYLTGLLESRKLGLCGVLFAMATYAFVSNSRSPSPDIFVAASTAAGFYIISSSDRRNAKLRLLLIPLCMIFGFIFRGPIGLVIPTAVFFIYYIVQKRIKAVFFLGVTGTCILALCLWGLWEAACFQGGRELAKAVFESQVGGRISKQKPFFYYFIDGLGIYALSYPMALLILGALYKKVLAKDSRPETKFIRVMAGWLLIIMIGMSIPGTKHMRYIISIVPAASLLCAYIFDKKELNGFLSGIRKYFIKLCSLFPFIVLAVFIIFQIIFSILKINIDIRLDLPVFLPLLCLAVLCISVLFINVKIKEDSRMELMKLSTGVATFIIICLFIIEPVEQSLENSKYFVSAVESKIANDGKIIFYRMGPDGEDIKYMVNANRNFIPLFIWGEEEIIKSAPRDIIIAKEDDFLELPEEIQRKCNVIYKGDLGHRECLALKVHPPK